MFRRRNPPTPDPFAHLESLRLYAEKKIQDELNWYYRKKSGRSVTSQALRLFAVILTVFGGLVPLLVSVFGARPRWHWLDAFANLRFGQQGRPFQNYRRSHCTAVRQAQSQRAGTSQV